MGTVKRDESGRWYFIFDAPRDADGKRRRVRRRGFRTKNDATTAMDTAQSEARRGLSPARGAVLTRDYLKEWLASCAGRVSPKTEEGYKRIVNRHLIPALGAVRLEYLTPAMVQRYCRDKLAAGLTAQTVLHQFRCLSTALEAAVRLQMIPRNVCGAVDPPRVRRRPPKTLTSEETAVLLESLAPTNLYLPALIAIATGMRESEILALTWRDIDLDRAAISLSGSLSETKEGGLIRKTPKSGAGRQIAMPAFLVEALRLHRALSVHDYVCCREDGAPERPIVFGNRWRRHMKKRGLTVTFHQLRHTHATIALELGIHPKIVQERLGHSRVGVTLDIYSHVLPSLQEDAAAQIDTAFMQAKARDRAEK